MQLRFGTTWQQLKDFAGVAAEVLHVEVFSLSTSGWVSVRGLDNFEKVFGRLDPLFLISDVNDVCFSASNLVARTARLNGAWFNGCCIIACDRNRTSPIMVRGLNKLKAAASRYQLEIANAGGVST